MGFRNPIRSAVDVDTGLPTGPGARLFQDTSSTYPRGVLEFRTGLAGDAPAGAELTSYQTTRPDGTIVYAGSRLRVRGADSNGVTAPALDLTVEEDPAGGYRAAARLQAARLRFPSDGDTLITLNSGLYKPAGGAFRAPTVLRRDGNEVRLAGSFTNAPAQFNAPAGFVYEFGTIPPELAPLFEEFEVTSSTTGGGYTVATIYARPSGALAYVPHAALGAGFVLSLNNLSWRLS